MHRENRRVVQPWTILGNTVSRHLVCFIKPNRERNMDRQLHCTLEMLTSSQPASSYLPRESCKHREYRMEHRRSTAGAPYGAHGRQGMYHENSSDCLHNFSWPATKFNYERYVGNDLHCPHIPRPPEPTLKDLPRLWAILCFRHPWLSLKGTVPPDIAFYFRVYKLKSVLSVRRLMAYKFVYFVVL